MGGRGATSLYYKFGGDGLDLSYHMLKKACETIVERYVMSKIPEI